MKLLKKIPFFIMFLISCLILTVCALIGRNNLYQEYDHEEELLRRPILSYPLAGIYDGIMPWETLDYLPYFSEQPNNVQLAENDLSDEVISGGESSGLLSANPDTDGGSITELSADMTDSTDHTTDAETVSINTAHVGDSGSLDIPQSDIPGEVNESEEDLQPEYGPDGLPIVHYIQVDESYFDDAIFIGDSRTRSLELYAGLENSTFLSETGLNIYTVLDKKLTIAGSSSKTTVRDYLTDHQFHKIYLMLGVNELGTGTAESFGETYLDVIQTIQELQPDAIIYVQAILHLSKEKDAQGTYINNANILERNAVLETFADNTRIFWLDANEALCDEDGYLISEYTFDGVHLQAKYVPIWLDWLMSHALEVESADTENTDAETDTGTDAHSETDIGTDITDITTETDAVY